MLQVCEDEWAQSRGDGVVGDGEWFCTVDLSVVDHDFSTPVILALRNQRNGVVRVLLEQERVCLRQQSTKYGTALHIALAN